MTNAEKKKKGRKHSLVYSKKPGTNYRKKVVENAKILFSRKYIEEANQNQLKLDKVLDKLDKPQNPGGRPRRTLSQLQEKQRLAWNRQRNKV